MARHLDVFDVFLNRIGAALQPGLQLIVVWAIFSFIAMKIVGNAFWYCRWLKSPEHKIVMADEEKKILVFIRSGREAQISQLGFGHSSHTTSTQDTSVD